MFIVNPGKYNFNFSGLLPPSSHTSWGVRYIVYNGLYLISVQNCYFLYKAKICFDNGKKKKVDYFFGVSVITFLFLGFMRFRWTLVHVFLKQIQRWGKLENQYLSDSRKWKCENIVSFSNLKCSCGYFSFRCVFISMYKLTYLW